ncbi:MAG: RNA polymerase sigma factor [Planctomycetota bacterium]|jgi:RNA polymerase sigma-70 factor (ECF subfamily)
MEWLRERLARGDQAAFAELYDSCADRLHHYLVVRLRSRHDADDVLQETFVRLARTRKRLSGVDNLVAYVFTIARNEAARLAARRTRRRKNRAGPAGSELFREAAGDDTRAREAAELVAAALDRLEPELREIVELKTYAALTFREIAEVTGLPQGTVATRYRTAIGQLRGWLAREMS